MSLAIRAERVQAVLLADGWHEIEVGSLDIDSYEFLWFGEDVSDDETAGTDPMTLHGGGQSGVCASGYSFRPKDGDGTRIGGPLTAILAVRYTG